MAARMRPRPVGFVPQPQIGVSLAFCGPELPRWCMVGKIEDMDAEAMALLLGVIQGYERTTVS